MKADQLAIIGFIITIIMLLINAVLWYIALQKIKRGRALSWFISSAEPSDSEPWHVTHTKLEPWFTTRCETCKHEVAFDDPIEPGQVSVVRCPQCGDAWAAVLPSVYVVKADRLELKQEQLISG